LNISEDEYDAADFLPLIEEAVNKKYGDITPHMTEAVEKKYKELLPSLIQIAENKYKDLLPVLQEVKKKLDKGVDYSEVKNTPKEYDDTNLISAIDSTDKKLTSSIKKVNERIKIGRGEVKEILNKIPTAHQDLENILPDDHHKEKHDLESHTESELSDLLNRLVSGGYVDDLHKHKLEDKKRGVGGGYSRLHFHDDVYYRKQEVVDLISAGGGGWGTIGAGTGVASQLDLVVYLMANYQPLGSYQASNAVLTELTALTDPGANRAVIWNDTSNNFEFLDYANWNTAYGWGNHASAGYVTGTPWTAMGYLTSLSGAVLTDQSTPQTVGLTGARLAMLWATDITCTNAIAGSVTGNAGTVTNATLTTALTVNTGAVTLTGNVAGSILTLGAGAVSVSGSNTGDQTLSSLGAQAALNGTGFVKISGTTISYDNSTYLTSVTAHNLLSTTHGDTTADTVVRGDIITGQGATPKWARLAFPATPTGKVLIATATDVAWSANALGTAAYAATGDFLAAGGTAVNSALLDSHNAAYFQTALTFGIADTNKVQINAADVADNDYAKFTATGLEGRSYSEVLSDIGAAATAQTFYIGTTQVAINRASNALTLAGLTLTTPDIGTPSAGVLTNTSGYANDVNLVAGKQINLTLPTTDAQCTGHVTSSFVAGENLTAGQVVFYKSDGKWWLTDSDAVATCKGLIGIALEAKNTDQAVKVALPNSMIHFDAWGWTAGDTLYIGDATAGTLQNSIPTGADCIIKVGGFAIDADTIFWNPSPDQQSAVA
jgi:ribosome-associated translation inhibitor RaiA